MTVVSQVKGALVKPKRRTIWSNVLTVEQRNKVNREAIELYRTRKARAKAEVRAKAKALLDAAIEKARLEAITVKLKERKRQKALKRKADIKQKALVKKIAERLKEVRTSDNAAYDIFPAEIVEYHNAASLPLIFRRVEGGCIVPISHRPRRKGYVTIGTKRFYLETARIGRKASTGLHRLAYEHANGPIPEGYDVDHLCGNPPCCNPRHLQAIARDEHAMLTAFNSRSRAMERVHMQWLMLSRKASAAQLAATLDMSLERVRSLLAMAIEQDQDDRRRWGLIAA